MAWSFYWEAVGASHSDSVLEGAKEVNKLCWKSPWQKNAGVVRKLSLLGIDAHQGDRGILENFVQMKGESIES